MFVYLANLTFVFTMLAGVWSTSDCLSEERRNETLGLLFLTRLRGFDVVLGKMAAGAVPNLYGVLAIFPVLAMPLIMGGVTLSEFLRVVLALISCLLVSLSMGVYVSSRSRQAVRSGGVTLLLMLGWCVGGPLLALISEASSPRGSNSFSTMAGLCAQSPGFTLFSAFDTTFSRSGAWYWVSIGINFALVVTLLAWACVHVRDGWRVGAASSTKGSHQKNLSRENESEVSKGRRPVPADVNPVYWALARQSMKPLRLYGLLSVVALYWLWGTLVFQRDFYNEANYLFTAFVMQIMLKFWITAEAVPRFLEDRKSGVLELLLCTPMRVNEIIAGHVQSFYWQFFWPTAMVLLVEVAFLLHPLMRPSFGADASIRFWALMFLAGIVGFIIDLYALSWLGMWKGLTSRAANRAVVWVLVWVLLVPWVAFVLLLMFLAWVLPRGVTQSAISEFTVLTFWFLICAGSSLGWWLWARRSLSSQLRNIAAVPVGKVGAGGANL